MRVFIKKIGFIIIVFVGLITMISFASLWSLRQSSFYKPSFLVNAIEQKQLDYIILGASTGLTTLNTKIIDSALQTKGLNLSMDDSGLSSQYLMLQHFIAQGKTTKYCVLAPHPSSFDDQNRRLSNNDYRFLPYVKSSYVSDYYKQYAEKQAKLLWLSKWFPMLGVSYFNAEIFYPSVLSLVNPKKRNRFDDKGNYTYPEKRTKKREKRGFKEVNIRFSNRYVQKIKALCDTNNITLICYLSPVKTKKYVTQASPYIIVNQSNLLNNTAYFYDETHVNFKGQKISSVNFAESFRNIMHTKN